jgi:hypothetical protein
MSTVGAVIISLAFLSMWSKAVLQIDESESVFIMTIPVLNELLKVESAEVVIRSEIFFQILRSKVTSVLSVK